jgi:secretion/DNA translocation related TadE-like protein
VGVAGADTRAGRPDAGSGVVLVLAVIAVTIWTALLVAALGNVIVARHRAEAAADLSALAAASAGPPPDCARAAAIAATSGARLLGCRSLPDGSVEVEVICALPAWIAAWAAGAITRPVGRARAGRPG